MADAERKMTNGRTRVEFETDPSRYRHWKLTVDGDVATLLMDVDEKGSLFEGYELKLNSYDLGVDIELADAIERLRFEHPQVRVILLRSGKPRVFCAGANIRMLAGSTHAHKVNFCKFTNETRNGLEDASAASDLKTICVINGTAAGGGYELALAADHIMLVDDGSSAVSLPELPLLAVLPGTGGLTRVTDKRKVRRDLADVFCTTEEGVKGKRAVDWRLVDEVVPGSKLDATVAAAREGICGALAASGRRQGDQARAAQAHAHCVGRRLQHAVGRGRGPVGHHHGARARCAAAGFGRRDGRAGGAVLAAAARARAQRCDTRPAPQRARHRGHHLQVGGRSRAGASPTIAFSTRTRTHWLAREIRALWKRVLKRVDLTSRTLVALIEPGSCFAGTLAELAFATDRSYMLIGNREGDNRPPASLMLADVNFGPYPMSNGLSRLASRFLADPADLDRAKAEAGKPLDAEQAAALGLITFALDDIDWDDEVRVFLEERASFSPDGLTGLEANLRFGGPETMESKIFARLTAWQNWIFQRPNAVGEEGALRRYGSGQKPNYDTKRV